MSEGSGADTGAARRPSLVARWADAPPDSPRPGITQQGFGTDDVVVVRNVISPELKPIPHRHEDFDQIAVVISGSATYHVGAVGNAVGPGSILVIPAGTDHCVEPAPDASIEIIEIFAPARSDYLGLMDWMTTFTG